LEKKTLEHSVYEGVAQKVEADLEEKIYALEASVKDLESKKDGL